MEKAASGELVRPTHAPDAWSALPMTMPALSRGRCVSRSAASARSPSWPHGTAGGARTEAGRQRGGGPQRDGCSPRRPAGRPPPARREYKKPRASGEKGGREGPTDHFGGELTWGRCVQGRAGADARVRRTPGECTRVSWRVVGCVPGQWPLVCAKNPTSNANGAATRWRMDQSADESPDQPIPGE